MGPHQAGRHLLAPLRGLAACSSSANAPSLETDQSADTGPSSAEATDPSPSAEAALADALAEIMVIAATTPGNSRFDFTPAAAHCVARAMAAEIGVARWENLGVGPPDYDWPPGSSWTPEVVADAWKAIGRCIADAEMLRRMLADEGLTAAQPNCVVAGLSEHGIGPQQWDELYNHPEWRDLQLAVDDIAAACLPGSTQ